MSFGQWASDYLGVPLEERFNFNPLTYFLYSGIDGAWFDPEDLSTMYQDTAGTIPVTALEQPVGLWLDKSQGLELGPELVTNGDFSNDTTGWVSASNVISAIISDELRIQSTSVGASAIVSQQIQTLAGRTYNVSGFARAGTSLDARITAQQLPAGSTIQSINTTSKVTKSINFSFTALGNTTYIGVRISSAQSVGETAYFDNISVREIKGNHATQSITASRPTLSARYNLLTKTEDFTDAVWAKALCTVTNVAISNPLNRAAVSKFVLDSTTGIHRIYQAWNPISGAKYSQGVILKSAGVRYVYINTSANLNAQFCIDLQTGQYVTAGTAPENPMVKYLGDGWYYASITGTGTSATGNNTLVQANRSLSASDDAGYAGNGIDGFYIIAAQLNIGTTPLTYQRVNTATDYDSVGWPRYLRGDGIDDFYNLPFMNLYGNGACSIVAARDAVSQATDTYIISERSTTDVDPKYFPSRQLASGGNMDSYIVSDEGTVRLDTTGSAFSGEKLAAIRSVVDSGSNIKLFKDGVVVADDNYTRAGTLTLNNTTLGASVSTTTSNYARMQLYGLIITKSALSDTDRKRCEQFLASRLSPLGVTLS